MAKERRSRKSTAYVPWSDLPSLILENIYTFLNRNDQTNMSLVCLKWSKGFNSPSVWKTIRFALTLEMLNKDNFSVNKFVKSYSNLIRHVQIEYCITNQKHLTELWFKHFETFLHILTKESKLASISFRKLKYFFRIAEYQKYQNTCRMIAKLLGSQRQLKRIEFHQCSFHYKDGIKLLKQAIESNTNLSCLKLQTFLHDEEQSNDVHEPAFKQILNTLFSLPSIEYLEINYSLILGRNINPSEVFEMLINCRKRMILKLFLEVSTNNLKILTSGHWRKLKESNLFLQVEIFLFTSSAFHQQNELFVVPNVPIRHITYQFLNPSSYRDVVSFLNHLLSCNINDHLVHFSFNMARLIPVVISTFFEFFKACKNLKILVLSLFDPMIDWNILLETLLECRPESLQEFRLEALEILNEDNKTMLRNLAARFKPFFISKNIEFSLYFK